MDFLLTNDFSMGITVGGDFDLTDEAALCAKILFAAAPGDFKRLPLAGVNPQKAVGANVETLRLDASLQKQLAQYQINQNTIITPNPA